MPSDTRGSVAVAPSRSTRRGPRFARTKLERRNLMIMNSRTILSNAGAALFLLSLASGCGSSSSAAAGADRDGSPLPTGGADAGRGGQSTSAGGTTSASGGGHAGGAGGATDAGGATSAGGAGGDAGPTPTAGLPVDLGTAAHYVALAKSGISTVPTSKVTGDLGVSPAAATYVTGFSLTNDATNAFATSKQVTGKIYAADDAVPTPSNLTTAVKDMELAFTNAAARAADVTELGAGNIGGKTIVPGVYKWGTGVLIPTDVTLAGGATAVWIFQIAKDLTVSNAVSVKLSGGALPKNVFWQVSGQAKLGTTSHLEGIVLTHTAITLGTGASINGRLLAQTMIAIDASTLVEPAG
jgi:hypothetical protein